MFGPGPVLSGLWTLVIKRNQYKVGQDQRKHVNFLWYKRELFIVDSGLR